MATKINKSQVMKRAHLLAQNFYEGNYAARMKAALKEAWAQIKKVAEEIVDLASLTAKQIFEKLSPKFQGSKFEPRIEWGIVAEDVFTKVMEESKGFQSDIAEIALEGNLISEKQRWCVAFEFLKLV